MIRVFVSAALPFKLLALNNSLLVRSLTSAKSLQHSTQCQLHKRFFVSSGRRSIVPWAPMLSPVQRHFPAHYGSLAGPNLKSFCQQGTSGSLRVCLQAIG